MTAPPLDLKAVLAMLAAAYLYEDDGCDPIVWRGLMERGVNYEAVIDVTGPILLRTCEFNVELGRFLIEKFGEQAFCHAVHGANDPELIIDIVAWSAMRPHRFGSYLGNAGLLGGDAALNPASFIYEPCPIWATPIAWLQSRLRGCVVLSPSLAAPIMVRAPGKFQCEDEIHARWLVEAGVVAVEKLMVPRRAVV
jgi:hypothetical protein